MSFWHFGAVITICKRLSLIDFSACQPFDFIDSSYYSRATSICPLQCLSATSCCRWRSCDAFCIRAHGLTRMRFCHHRLVLAIALLTVEWASCFAVHPWAYCLRCWKRWSLFSLVSSTTNTSTLPSHPVSPETDLRSAGSCLWVCCSRSPGLLLTDHWGQSHSRI